MGNNIDIIMYNTNGYWKYQGEHFIKCMLYTRNQYKIVLKVNCNGKLKGNKYTNFLSNYGKIFIV